MAIRVRDQATQSVRDQATQSAEAEAPAAGASLTRSSSLSRFLQPTPARLSGQVLVESGIWPVHGDWMGSLRSPRSPRPPEASPQKASPPISHMARRIEAGSTTAGSVGSASAFWRSAPPQANAETARDTGQDSELSSLSLRGRRNLASDFDAESCGRGLGLAPMRHDPDARCSPSAGPDQTRRERGGRCYSSAMAEQGSTRSPSVRCGAGAVAQSRRAADGRCASPGHCLSGASCQSGTAAQRDELAAQLQEEKEVCTVRWSPAFIRGRDPSLASVSLASVSIPSLQVSSLHYKSLLHPAPHPRPTHAPPAPHPLPARTSARAVGPGARYRQAYMVATSRCASGNHHVVQP